MWPFPQSQKILQLLFIYPTTNKWMKRAQIICSASIFVGNLVTMIMSVFFFFTFIYPTISKAHLVRFIRFREQSTQPMDVRFCFFLVIKLNACYRVWVKSMKQVSEMNSQLVGYFITKSIVPNKNIWYIFFKYISNCLSISIIFLSVMSILFCYWINGQFNIDYMFRPYKMMWVCSVFHEALISFTFPFQYALESTNNIWLYWWSVH